MFNRGGFSGPRPMGHMNQPGMGHSGMNLSGMNMPGMNMSGMGISPMNLSGMNQPSMNLSGMNQPNLNLSGMNLPGLNQHMGLAGMTHSNMGLSGMNQPNMNLNRMNLPGMNQGGGGGGMGFLSDMNKGFGMRPMSNTGPFMGGNADPIGMKGMPMRPPMHTPDRLMGSQVLSQRFQSPSVPVHQGQPRMPSQSQGIPSIVNRVVTHPSDRMMMKPKPPLQEKQWGDKANVFGNVGQEMGMKPMQSGPPLGQVSKGQNRYTNESASSILESFGLSNEDLEELSRYPDDQLTPSNMPAILRDIRLRKLNKPPTMPVQAAGRRPGNEVVASKVIDYGHASKYNKFNPAAATPARSYNPPRTEQKTPVAPKVTPAPSNAKPLMKTPEKGMDNKIPTIFQNRKPAWQPSKARPNNKTLVGQETPAPVNVSNASVTVSTVKNPVITIQANVPAVPNVTAPVQAKLPAVQAVTAIGQVSYQPTEAPAAGQGSWAPPVLPQEETQKMKKMPTPSMMNDYYAASPRIFPHICSLCNVECRHLKDWIKHQNNSSHIESCRNLRQQYPEWNPQVLSSVRNEAKNVAPNAKKSRSKSTSPQRSRRSESRNKSRKSRSRSRSPRRSRHSPRRSRSPRRGTRSPRHSRSPRKYKRSSRSNSPDKKAVDAAVQSFIEATKKKTAKPSTNGKKQPPPPPPSPKPSNANVKNKKPAVIAPTPKKPGVSAPPKPVSTPSSNNSSKKPLGNNNNGADKPGSNIKSGQKTPIITPAKKPYSGNTNYKKPVVSTGAKKTTPSTPSGKKPVPGKQPASNQKTSDSTETSTEANAFTTNFGSGKVIHVTNLPDDGYTDQDLLKIAQPFGKVCDVLIVRSKNEAFIETHFSEAASAAIKFSESTPVIINNQRITLSMAGKYKKMKAADKIEKEKELPARGPPAKVTPAKAPPAKEPPAKAPVKTDPPKKEEANKSKILQEKSRHDIEVPPGFVMCYMLDDPPLKQSERCVVLISNLPAADYTVKDIIKLAKPFGGTKDVLVAANHKKAYLELPSKTFVDSMIKFYSVFPTYLGGNLLSICIATRFKDLKNEDLIFADLIEQASYKITPTIYEKFVCLSNVPEKDVEDFEIIRVGLRFGRVEHHLYIPNKKKAILLLHSPTAAKSMYSFLKLYPCSIKENVVECSLPSKTKLAEDEYISYIEEETQSPEIITEKTAPAAPEPEKPKDEPKGKEVAVASAPVSESKMEVDTAENKEASAPPPAEESTTTSAQVPDEPSNTEPISSSDTVVATEDDDEEDDAAEDDDYEEEAAVAPDTSPLYVQPVPETQEHQVNHPVSQPQMLEDLEVLVTVESDEEDCEEQNPFMFSNKQELQAVPVMDEVGETSMSELSENEGMGKKTGQKSAKSSSVQGTPDGRGKTSDGGSAGQKGRGGSETAATSSVSMIRTTKYNAKKGEISVTVTVDSQKSAAKGTDSRKRWESSSQRSNSNRSSPANGASGHSKSGSKYGKYTTSQSERDSKDTNRSRDRDDRSSGRKDDRVRGSSSSRYPRSFKGSNRSPRSKGEEETFPFNLDEFVTVDEIVEEHVGSKDEKADAAKKAKRNDPPSSDSKKSRGTSKAPHGAAFVTLDEVCDEDCLVTVDDESADDPPAITKKEQMLMTLDEISDDDDAQDSESHGAAKTKLLGGKKGTEGKGNKAQQNAPAKGDHSKQSLLTVGKAKADEMSFADIEHQFLTVDEIGEEEEESERKAEQNKRKLSETCKTPSGAESAAKKTKLAPPSAGSTKLTPHNSNTPVETPGQVRSRRP